MTISQPPTSNVSSPLGNFAIHKCPFSSATLAFGRAPPNEDPGATKRFNQCKYSGSVCTSSCSKRKLICANSLSEVQAGTAYCLLSSKKGPSKVRLNRRPPILLPSKTPNKKSNSVRLLDALFSKRARAASLLRNKTLPQRSGEESKNNPKFDLSTLKYCKPLLNARSGSSI